MCADIPLAPLHPRQLLDQLVLDQRRAGQLGGHRLDLLEPLAGLPGRGPTRIHQLHESLLLRRNRSLVLPGLLERPVHLVDLALQRRDLRREPQQLVLDRPDGIELLLHVGNLQRQSVTQTPQRLHVCASAQLLFDLPIDIATQGIQRVEAGFDLFNELLVARDPRHLSVEIICNGQQGGRLQRFLIHHRELAANRIDPRVELRHRAFEFVDTPEEAFEGRPIGRDLVAQLGGLGLRLVERLDLLAQHLHVLPALPEGIELPPCSL